MGSAMPDNDGFVLWVKTAFGPYWGFMVAVMNWLNYITGNAVYPVLFMYYLTYSLNQFDFIHENLWYYLIQFGFLFFVMMLNLIGVDLVGSASSVFAVIILSPFVIIFVWAAAVHRIDPANFIALPPVVTQATIIDTFNVIMWSYAGYEMLGSVVEELKDAKKNFIRANMVLIAMSISTYFVAFIGTIGLDTDWASWESGHFVIVAYSLGGTGLKMTMVVVAMISALGTYNALLCASSQSLRALGAPDLLGSRLLRYVSPSFNTPWVAIIINTLGTGSFSFFSFEQLVIVNNIVYSLTLMLTYATLIRLRYTHKDMERPFRISQSIWPTVMLVIPPICIALFIVGSSVFNALIQLAIVGVIFVLGSLLYLILYLVRRPTRESMQSLNVPSIQTPTSY
jgi:amino acid transporter